MPLFLIEQSWKPITILLLVVAAAVVVFRLTQRRGALGLALIALALAVAVFGLDYWFESPAEQVRGLLNALAKAAAKGDAESIVGAISPQYSGDGRNHAGVVAQIRKEIGRGDIQAVSLSGVDVQADETKAVARFLVFVDGTYEGMSAQRVPLRMRLALAREVGGWKITKAQRFHPLQKTEEEIPLFSR